jgi:hypothetical protein
LQLFLVNLVCKGPGHSASRSKRLGRQVQKQTHHTLRCQVSTCDAPVNQPRTFSQNSASFDTDARHIAFIPSKHPLPSHTIRSAGDDPPDSTKLSQFADDTGLAVESGVPVFRHKGEMLIRRFRFSLSMASMWWSRGGGGWTLQMRHARRWESRCEYLLGPEIMLRQEVGLSEPECIVWIS